MWWWGEKEREKHVKTFGTTEIAGQLAYIHSERAAQCSIEPILQQQFADNRHCQL